MGDDIPENVEFKFQTVGEQLKAERERQSLSLSDIAMKTRIPQRHLESIEKSQFAALPGSTYSIGFAKSYARALGLDDQKIADDLRSELTQGGHDLYQAPTQNYEPADPSRVPPRTLAWTAAGIAVLFLAGYLVWRSNILSGTPSAPIAAAIEAPVVEKLEPAVTANAGGDVVLTATGEAWIKVYGADRKRIFENTMKAGDTFTVPKDANGPMILTGRPDLITVTIGGKAVAPLGTANRTISDVGVSAEALLARPPATTPDQAVAPAPTGTTTTPAPPQ